MTVEQTIEETKQEPVCEWVKGLNSYETCWSDVSTKDYKKYAMCYCPKCGKKINMKSIEEGFPIVGLNVLCQWEKADLIHNSKDIYQTIMHRNADNEWISEFGVCTGRVTHWMHLPFVV